jgi:CheY-like chemotaxis protein
MDAHRAVEGISQPVHRQLLLIDDEVPITTVLATTLRAHGWAVVTAPDALAGLAALATTSPDVILLDVNLPDLTGWELLRRLPAGARHIPVVVFSASPLAPSRVREFAPAGVLTKPFPMEALLRLLDQVAAQPGNEED